MAAGSSEVRVPANIQARAHQRLLTFRGIVDKAAPQSTFNVSVGEDSDLVEDQITVLPSGAPVLSLPQTQLVKTGESISFQVSAQDPSGLPVQISAAKLPAGASFRQDSGRFEWSPAPNQEGANIVTFTAVNSSGGSSKSQTQILVDSGTPSVAKAVRALCGPGAVATLEGRWFSPAGEDLTDPSGSSLELGGTRVHVNDTLAPVLFASQTRVDFLCPGAAAGSNLAVSLDTLSGSTSPVETTMLAARPNLLRAQDLDEKQGQVTILGSGRIATVRDYRNAGEPAQIDDLISLRATGLGISGSDSGSLLIKIGGEEARVESIVPAPGAAGVSLIQVRIPTTAPLGDDIPVSLQLLASDGKRVSSNTVTLAIE